MSGQTKTWTLDEEKVLRELKEANQSNKRVNWKNICKSLNYKCNTHKTPKQCREHFSKHLQFGEGAKASLKWEKEQLEQFLALYLEHGSCWSFISRFFKNRSLFYNIRSENAVKNMFNNTIKCVSKRFHNYERRVLKKYKKGITVKLLTTLIDLSNEIKKKLTMYGLTMNKDSKIFIFRNSFLRYCFGMEKKEILVMENLILLIKQISSKLKCFSIFKLKHHSQLKLSSKYLTAIYQFDEICIQNLREISRSKEAIECLNQNQSPQMELLQLFNERVEKNQSKVQLIEISEFHEALGKSPNSAELDDLDLGSFPDHPHLLYF